MRVTIAAVGRMKAAPEAELVNDYLKRFDRTGRALGLGPSRLVEVEDRKGGSTCGEADLLRKALPNNAARIALDERGSLVSSREFAALIARHRDDGARDLGFVIGGADGIHPSLRDDASRILSFGKMVWPHMLARVMLCEQLYRAVTILAGGPYHRD